jgi:hypothetical protein
MKKNAESILMRQLTIEFDMRILFKTLIEIRSYGLLKILGWIIPKSCDETFHPKERDIPQKSHEGGV